MSQELQDILFLRRLPSAYGVNTPLVGATLVNSLSVSQTTNKFPERLLFASISAVVFLLLEYFSYVEPLLIYVFPLTGEEHAPWYIWPQIFLFLLTIRPFLSH